MRKYLIAAAATSLMAGAAQAANPPSITFTPGVYTVPSYTSAAIFETFGGGVAGTAYNATTQRTGPYAEATTGTVVTGAGNVPGQGFTPDGDANTFLAIQNGTFSISFGTVGVQFLSFAFGTLDTFNSVELFFADGTSQLLSGLGIINGAAANTPAGTPPSSPGQTGRVSYNANGGFGITSVRFGSTQAAFEIDDIAVAAPEPATWGMMILGFGLAGAALRLRRRKATVSFA